MPDGAVLMGVHKRTAQRYIDLSGERNKPPAPKEPKPPTPPKMPPATKDGKFIAKATVPKAVMNRIVKVATEMGQPIEKVGEDRLRMTKCPHCQGKL